MNQIFDSTEERYTFRYLTGQVRSVIVQHSFCPLHIRTIFVLSVIHPLLIRQSSLVDRSLSATCPLHMRYSCILGAPYTSRKDPHRHGDGFHHRTNTGIFFCFFFSPFCVRYPYPLICDSTITYTHLQLPFVCVWSLVPLSGQISHV